MPFVDEARIFIKAGDGGKGCRSFYRDKFGRYPKPDGGDGGEGQDIVFLTDSNVYTLLDFQFRQHFLGEKGGNGGSNSKKGKDQPDCVIKVPIGTTIKDLNTNCILRDLNRAGQRLIAAKGGMGGKGNIHRDEPTPPQPGEEKTLLLELKLIADCGIVGFPNAGKSSLINAITSSKSKVADYPFTTKEPRLGVIKSDEYSIVIADLPGLIEGAHEGKGLGLKFLKHAKRTKVLIHLLDMAGVDGRNPIDDFKELNQELKFFSQDLSAKPQIIVANKMDLPQAQINLRVFLSKIKKKVFVISAKNKEGLTVLVDALKKKICKENSLIK
ncbi:MAG: Obg family GTPase CgtA [Candidatus Omnitrophota bacterium]|nr:Obg family GTPase CgtA [Candidatus Omnitrophota bacterium]